VSLPSCIQRGKGRRVARLLWIGDWGFWEEIVFFAKKQSEKKKKDEESV